MVFRQRGLEHCQRLIEAARGRLADLELEKEIERLKAEAGRRAAGGGDVLWPVTRCRLDAKSWRGLSIPSESA